MHYMFLIFMTLNGHPMGPTMHIEPVSADCRNEILLTQALNATQVKEKTNAAFYGSCEPFKQ